MSRCQDLSQKKTLFAVSLTFYVNLKKSYADAHQFLVDAYHKYVLTKRA